MSAWLGCDALAWGRLGAHETLFWPEVESGHSSREKIRRKVSRRLHQAMAYAEAMDVHLVFALLGMLWTICAAAEVFINLS